MDPRPNEPGHTVDAIRLLVEAQRELARLYEDLWSTVQLPLADSPGMAEIADEARFVNEQWPNPVQVAHAHGGLLTVATVDHFAAYTRMLAEDPMPFFSTQVTARAGLDAAGLAYWLNEPAIGTKGRVQRGQAILLGAAREMAKAPDHLTDTHAEADRIAANVRDGAMAHGWSISEKRHRPRVGDEMLPFPKSAIETALDDPSFAHDPNPAAGGDDVWWLLSGYTHSGVHILVQHVEQTRAADRSPLGIGEGRLGVAPRSTLVITATLGRGVRKAMNAYRRLVGAKVDGWEDAHQRWSRTVVALLKAIRSDPPEGESSPDS
jgi:hypothetical protein